MFAIVSGFQSTNRANPLAQKILASDIELGVTSEISFYTADNCEFLRHIQVEASLTSYSGAFLSNNTEMPPTANYMAPPTSRQINGQTYVESQRFLVGVFSGGPEAIY